MRHTQRAAIIALDRLPREIRPDTEVGAQLPGVRMNHKARITGSDVPRGFRLAFLITNDVAQGRQAARHGVRAAGNALTERDGGED